MSSLGIRVKQLRKSKSLTQDELGTIVGLHGTNIGRIEKGTLVPTADVIQKMATYFNVSCDYIITGESANMQFYSEQQKRIVTSIQDFSEEEFAELESQIDYIVFKRSKRKELSISIDQNSNAKMA